MESGFYEGYVKHCRQQPVQHDFAFPLYMAYLDLEELPELMRMSWLWSDSRPALAWFRREDYLGDPATPLSESVRDCVEDEVGQRPEGPVRLLTHPRYVGIRMNPISLYYCFHADGRRLEAVVGEVTNTPWGERHTYVLSPEVSSGHTRSICETPKNFHVSPFMAMDLKYHWSLSPPGSDLSMHIVNQDIGGSSFFSAQLELKRREWTRSNCRRALWLHPAQTAQVGIAIYWQALRLYWKGVPFHPHPPTAGASEGRVS